MRMTAFGQERKRGDDSFLCCASLRKGVNMARCWHIVKMCVLVFLGLGYQIKQHKRNLIEMNEYQPLLTDSARQYSGYVLEQSEEENVAKRTKLKMEIVKMMPIIILSTSRLMPLAPDENFSLDDVHMSFHQCKI